MNRIERLYRTDSMFLTSSSAKPRGDPLLRTLFGLGQERTLVMVRFHYNAGYQKALHDDQQFRRTLMGVPLFLFPQLARNAAIYIRKAITQGPDFAFRQQMTVGNFVGTMLGYASRGRRT